MNNSLSFNRTISSSKSVTHSLNIYSIYVLVLAFFPVSTLLQGAVSAINKILIVILAFIMLAIIASNKMSKWYWVLLLFTGGSFVISFVNTGTLNLINSNLPFYFIFWMTNIIIFCNCSSHIIREMVCYKKILLLYVLVWSALVLISLFFSSSYSYSAGVRAFASFTGETFRFCTSVFGILGLVFPLMKIFGRKSFFLCVVPLITLFMCGSRTYFAIGLLLVVIQYYFFCKSKKAFWLSIIPVAIVVVLLATNSIIGERFAYSNQEGYFCFLYTFTSGRSTFWVTDLNAFRNASFFNRLFGLGFNASYEINILAKNGSIWSHNDFIESLLCGGYVQLALYLISYFLLCKHLLAGSNKFIFALMLFILIFDAFFNMFYTYFATNIGFLLTALFLNKSKIKKTLLSFERKEDLL